MERKVVFEPIRGRIFMNIRLKTANESFNKKHGNKQQLKLNHISGSKI